MPICSLKAHEAFRNKKRASSWAATCNGRGEQKRKKGTARLLVNYCFKPESGERDEKLIFFAPRFWKHRRKSGLRSKPIHQQSTIVSFALLSKTRYVCCFGLVSNSFLCLLTPRNKKLCGFSIRNSFRDQTAPSQKQWERRPQEKQPTRWIIDWGSSRSRFELMNYGFVSARQLIGIVWRPCVR